MIEISFADERIPNWYGVTVQYPTPELAYAAFVALHDSDPRGSMGVGIYRHLRVGLDEGAVLVSVVGMKPEGVARAASILSEGTEIEMHMSSWLGLIARRAEVVGTLLGSEATAGRYRMLGDEPFRV